MKNIIIILLSLFVCILAFYAFFYKKEETKKSSTLPPEVEIFVKSEVEKVNKEIDKKGFEHAIADAVQNTVGNIQHVRDSAKRELDSISNLRNIDKKQIEEWKAYATSWRDSFLIAKQNTDTSYNFKDSHANIEFVIPKSDSSKPYFNYSYDATINYLEYWEKKNLFSKKKHYIDFWIEDPRATINGMKRIKVLPKEDKNSFSLKASAMYFRNLNLGLEGDIKLGRTNLGIGYYYDFNFKDWVPKFSAKHSILQF